MRPRLALAVVLLATFAGNAWFAAHPSSGYQSADERSYGKLAVNLADQRHYGDPSTGMSQPLHWPPGAPALFALAYTVSGSPASARETFDIPAAYWAQALVSTGTAAAAAALVWLLAGAWPGVVAALLVGLYPPLLLSSGEQISEPLGAFLLTAALLALAVATRPARAAPGGAAAPRCVRSWWAWPLAGALLGLCVLTRTDLLPVPFLLAGLGGLVALWRVRRGRSGNGVVRAVAGPALLLVAAVLVIAPWTVYASMRAGSFVPVTKGSASALFVGTYLPGNGTTVGMKRALAPELKARRPSLRGRGSMDIDAADYLALVASRHPDLPRDAAVSRAGKENVKRYVRQDPAGFALMMANKVQRMWTRYARGGARHTSWVIRVWHILLVGFAVVGVVLGLRRRRDAVLGAVVVTVLFSTAIHTLVVSQARYNLPLMPALIAAGVVGWAWARARTPAQPATRAARRPAAVS